MIRFETGTDQNMESCAFFKYKILQLSVVIHFEEISSTAPTDTGGIGSLYSHINNGNSLPASTIPLRRHHTRAEKETLNRKDSFDSFLHEIL